MKWLLVMLIALSLSACTGFESEKPRKKGPETDPAQVGVVNHTGNYIYSSSVNGTGGAICLHGGLEEEVFVVYRFLASGIPV